MGAAAATTGAMPAINATAATINIPGIGGIDVPVPQEFDAPVQELNKQLEQALSAAPAIPPASLGTLPQVPQGGLFGNVQEHQTPAVKALDAARSKVGAQYSWGAAGPARFDCSGLVQWAYRQAGIELPRTSFEQSHVGAPVAFQNLQPGDIVITNGGGHVGIYAGDGKLLNAVQSGTPVSYTTLSPDDVVTARRVS
ncbi:C40 family peptidase [Nocardia sp. NEAU-351]|uniref:C40 family peptidase n=1 Tax=Nocardia bovistercoris TaxID=2785916 RepID=A0A931ICG1_9NOCA|nr:NlpC/P60 family protein [Nocardia bovistercoris]MBH0778556.1 C40 family peptidase [Nocardia bovistercoris]